MGKSTETTCPAAIRTRADAVQLWKHLLARGISFHWEDAPAEWVDHSGKRVLSRTEAMTIERLFNEVIGLHDDRCYTDAIRLLKRATVHGLESIH
ncbi:MAG: hypothetical protein DI536_26000 [Archangium gephyra]|uniref:Uncharacterized protein n=1 Tax=Archangium gephyra TaxID=48 RepID=A0A2W5SXH6_9BACT|nr:MAG: hypothetical protein DI536_26000 [Archangium gephyra]